MAPGVTGMEGSGTGTRDGLSFGIALTFALSLLANAVKAIVGDRVLCLAEQPALFLLAAPGALFLVFIAARFALLPRCPPDQLAAKPDLPSCQEIGLARPLQGRLSDKPESAHHFVVSRAGHRAAQVAG